VTKIAFIGAGSLEFTRGLVRDVLTFPLLQDATLALMDIDAERLDFSHKSVQRIVDMGNYPARVEPTMDRAEALKGADLGWIPTSATRAAPRASFARCAPSR
jgi:alpha-galactosidase